LLVAFGAVQPPPEENHPPPFKPVPLAQHGDGGFGHVEAAGIDPVVHHFEWRQTVGFQRLLQFAADGDPRIGVVAQRMVDGQVARRIPAKAHLAQVVAAGQPVVESVALLWAGRVYEVGQLAIGDGHRVVGGEDGRRPHMMGDDQTVVAEMAVHVVGVHHVGPQLAQHPVERPDGLRVEQTEPGPPALGIAGV